MENQLQDQAYAAKFSTHGVTFDDVLLVPAYSEVLPREVDLSSRVSRKITVNTPIVSAAMDTVTEWQMAIALARHGGIGFLHKNMNIAQQAAQVRKVKRSESGMILDPVTLHKDATVGDAQQMMREHRIGGIPVIDQESKLVGIITNRDLRFETESAGPMAELMTSENLITAPEGTTLAQAEVILKEHRIEKGYLTFKKPSLCLQRSLRSIACWCSGGSYQRYFATCRCTFERGC